MKKVKYDPKLLTLPGGERQGLPKLTQKQLDAAIRKAKGKHAVVAMIADTKGWQDYVLDDGTVLQIHRHRRQKTDHRGFLTQVHSLAGDFEPQEADSIGRTDGNLTQRGDGGRRSV